MHCVEARRYVSLAFVAKSAPEGHTLLQCNVASGAIAMSLDAKLPFDQLRDLVPITRIGTTPNILVVHPSMPIRSVKEPIAYAKANPRKLSYAAGPVGTSPQRSMELIKQTTNIDVVHISYKNTAQATSDVIGGQVPAGVFNLQALVALVQSGRLRALALTSANRMPQLPAIPTLVDARSSTSSSARRSRAGLR